MQEKFSFAEILLPLAVQGTFTYSIPPPFDSENLTGKRVLVNFGKGKKLYTGLVVSVGNNKPDIPVKDIIDVLDKNPIAGQYAVQFWNWMSLYYMCFTGEVMNAAFPGILNVSSESVFSLNPFSQIISSSLKPNEIRVLNSLESSSELSLAEISRISGQKNPIRQILSLVEKNVILMKQDFKSGFSEKKSASVSLSDAFKNKTNLEEVILSLSKAPKQLKMLMTMIEKTGWDGENLLSEKVKKKDLLKVCQSGESALKALIEKDLLQLSYESESRLFQWTEKISGLKELNDDQTKCLKLIKAEFEHKEVVLLHGVTSSGKTEVYAHLISQAISDGKQVLYMLPEISLTGQLINRLRHYFGDKISVYHSRMSQQERAEVWKRVAENDINDIRIILGPRSSIFLPFNDLGLIVVDEEHDRSFKQQDPAPRYEARDSAIVLAKFHKAKVLLGSATPSLESIENAGSGKYGYVELNSRYGGFQMPELLAVDLKEAQRKRKKQGSFSSELLDEIGNKLKSGEQVILFQNRRGYAPLLICDNCAHSPKCKNCDVTLTFHKKINLLICHYCGYRISRLKSCPECLSGKLEEAGAGTEKIEEELSGLFPSARLSRFDLDSTRGKYAFQKLLDDFESGDIDILIGTQMVTKGLDFENVGLVGIINADNLLKFPDFRSFERTFQLLVQVSGRAGRKKKRGKVIIQTYDAFHPVIQFALENNYKGFVKAEMKERKLFKYPPYYRILNITMKHRERKDLQEGARVFAVVLKKLMGERLLGPEFPYIERIRNLYSVHFIVKVSKNDSVSSIKNKLAKSIYEFINRDSYKSFKIFVDVDPY